MMHLQLLPLSLPSVLELSTVTLYSYRSLLKSKAISPSFNIIDLAFVDFHLVS